MRHRVRFLVLLVLLGLLAPGLARPAAAALVVAVSVAPQAEIVRRLGGDAVEVVVLLPPGADVETFAPAPQQIKALARAALVFEVGHPGFFFERTLLGPWLDRHPEVARIALSGFVPPSPAAGAADDPHLWMSPRAMRAAAGGVERELERLLPDQAPAIAGRWADLDREIAALDAELVSRFAGAAGRSFLVYHPALGRFAGDYGLAQLAIEHEGKEPSPAHLARRIAEARRAGARAVLVQRGMPVRAAELLAREIGARVIEIDPLAPDWLANARRVAGAVAAALTP